jgi:ABC-type sugar transport system permease subunit
MNASTGSAGRFRLTNPRYGLLLNIPGLLIVLLWVVFPALLLFAVSFLRFDNVNPVSFVGFGNYQRLWNSRVFAVSVERVLVFSLGSTALTAGGAGVPSAEQRRVRKGGMFVCRFRITP